MVANKENHKAKIDVFTACKRKSIIFLYITSISFINYYKVLKLMANYI